MGSPRNRNSTELRNARVGWRRVKGPAEGEAEVLTFHQVESVRQERPENKGALVCGGLFLPLLPGPDLMKCVSETTTLSGSRASLCQPGRAFVHAVSQLSFLLGSRSGSRSIYLQIDFCKTILSSRPYPSLSLTSAPFPRQSGHSVAAVATMCLAVVSEGGGVV